MASTIAAGTSAGTAIAISGDTSGALVLQTNGTTTAVTIDTSQNVGIGASSPTVKLQITAPVVNNAVSVAQIVTNAGTGNAGSGIGLGYGTGNGYYAQLAGVYDNTGSAFTVSTSALNVAATEQMRIDSAGLLKFNSGYGSAATAYGCRAWVNFNGTGTVAIRASGNVSSITDRGVGLYTVNFTTAMPDTNYCYQICARDDDNGMSVPTAQADPAAAQPPTTTTLPIIYNYPPSQGFYDANAMTVAIFR